MGGVWCFGVCIWCFGFWCSWRFLLLVSAPVSALSFQLQGLVWAQIRRIGCDCPVTQPPALPILTALTSRARCPLLIMIPRDAMLLVYLTAPSHTAAAAVAAIPCHHGLDVLSRGPTPSQEGHKYNSYHRHRDDVAAFRIMQFCSIVGTLRRTPRRPHVWKRWQANGSSLGMLINERRNRHVGFVHGIIFWFCRHVGFVHGIIFWFCGHRHRDNVAAFRIMPYFVQ